MPINKRAKPLPLSFLLFLLPLFLLAFKALVIPSRILTDHHNIHRSSSNIRTSITTETTAAMPRHAATEPAATMLHDPPVSIPNGDSFSSFSSRSKSNSTGSSNDAGADAGHSSSASIPMPRTFTDGLALPRVFIFDLDYTLWPFWCDTHLTPPLKAHTSTSVQDRYGGTYGFYGEVPSVIAAARAKGIKIAAASRTHTPDIARKLLRLLHVQCFPETEIDNDKDNRDHKNGKITGKWRPAIELFDDLQIYPGNKVAHVTRISKALGEAFSASKSESASRPASAKVAEPSTNGEDESDEEEKEATRRRRRKAVPVAAAFNEAAMPYSEMLFFDDEQRNANTERERGVCFWLVRDGVTREEVDKAVWKWRRLRGIAEPSSSHLFSKK